MQQAELKTILLPEKETNLWDSGFISGNSITGSTWILNIEFPYPNQGDHERLTNELEQVATQQGLTLQLSLNNVLKARQVQQGVQALPNVKNIIAVASAKGGVGKSTISVNLACALAQEGAKVGLLDADVYGPSIPTMLGSQAKPETLDGKTMEPIEVHGIKTMSIGYLVAADTAMIWRGPILSQTLSQLLNETNWGDLDYLILDLPPGTGDTQLTLAQKIPVSGSVLVTTPQQVALADARKGLAMFEKVNIDVLGVVENMSGYICPSCGYEEAIFSQGGGERLAKTYDTQVLGIVPLDIQVRSAGDSGQPLVTQDHPLAERYKMIARRTSALLAEKSVEYSGKFPQIVVEGRS